MDGTEARLIPRANCPASPGNNFFRIPDRLLNISPVQRDFIRITDDDAVGAKDIRVIEDFFGNIESIFQLFKKKSKIVLSWDAAWNIAGKIHALNRLLGRLLTVIADDFHRFGMGKVARRCLAAARAISAKENHC